VAHGYCVAGAHYGLTHLTIVISDRKGKRKDQHDAVLLLYPPLQGFGMPSGEISIEPWFS